MSNSKVSEKTFSEFLQLCAKLEPTDFLGLCRILCVQTATSEKDADGHVIPRSFESIFSDVMDKFLLLDRPQRRQLMKLLRQVAQINIDEARKNAAKN